jgi:hypothetical protein
MKLFLIFITLIFAHCPDNINSYNGDIDGLKIDLNNLPDKFSLEKFILSNFSLPNPVLSSYFAYQIRFVFEHLHCFNEDKNIITFSLDGTVKFSGNVQNHDSLLKLSFIFDEITKDVLYSSRKIHSNEISDSLITDYNIECVYDTEFVHPQIRNVDNCDRMLVYKIKSHVFNKFLKLFQSK